MEIGMKQCQRGGWGPCHVWSCRLWLEVRNLLDFNPGITYSSFPVNGFSGKTWHKLLFSEVPLTQQDQTLSSFPLPFHDRQASLGQIYSPCGKGCPVKPCSIPLQATLGSKLPLAVSTWQPAAPLASDVPVCGLMKKHLPVLSWTHIWLPV